MAENRKLIELTPLPGCRCYAFGEVRIITSRAEEDNDKLHVSISCSDRFPTWDEITEIKNLLAPELFMVQVLAPKKHHVNIHPNCFHLWEVSPDQRWQRGIV